MKTISSGGLHAGMKKKEASSSDASTKLKMSPTVDESTTRSGPAKTPAPLGPRSA